MALRECTGRATKRTTSRGLRRSSGKSPNRPTYGVSLITPPVVRPWKTHGNCRSFLVKELGRLGEGVAGGHGGNFRSAERLEMLTASAGAEKTGCKVKRGRGRAGHTRRPGR